LSLLAIDIGNTETALGLDDRGAWRRRWRLRTSPSRTSDEYAAQVAMLLELEALHVADVSAVAIASVVPNVTPVFAEVARGLFGLDPLIVGPGCRTGIRVRYRPPADLGSDRVLDAVAARSRYGAPAIVVDFGTATTVTVVDSGGALAGGAIAPGVGVAADALVESGSRLPGIDLTQATPARVVGRNTEDSMRSGVLYGYAGLVSGLVDRVEAELAAESSAPPAVVATGGLAGRMAPLIPRVDHTDPDLTLDGLRLIYELNAHDRTPV
jgi:type III pantothenate kinase